MSHTSTIAGIVMADKTIVAQAIEELKSQGIRCELLENAKPRAYYSDQSGMGTAPLVVKLQDAKYDVGLYPRGDGKGFEARTDFFGGSVEKVLGAQTANSGEREQAKLGKLYQAYAIQAATREAIRKGYSVQRINKADGSVQLQVVA
jgi:hypothetical protein